MGAVTYVCIGCGLLSQSERSHTITCSAACRVRAHRNGSAKALRDLAAAFKIDASDIAQAEALSILRPDLEQAVASGALDIPDAQADLNRAFVSLVFRAAGIKRSSALPGEQSAAGALQ